MVEEWNGECPKCKALIEAGPIEEEAKSFAQNRYLFKCEKCGNEFWVEQINVLEGESSG